LDFDLIFFIVMILLNFYWFNFNQKSAYNCSSYSACNKIFYFFNKNHSHLKKIQL